MNPTQTLQKYFGYQSFRPGQLAIVESIRNKHDTLVIMPTGGGKSICFQVPGLLFPGTTLVISPLISLMKDQVDALLKKNIAATFINSTLDINLRHQRLALMQQNKYRFVYVSPERLQLDSFMGACQKIKISFMAVDEAHCISQWGHDFRPSYTRIAEFVNELPYRPTIAAFTATATPEVQNDITNQLQLIKPTIFKNGFKRGNLIYWVKNCQNSFEQQLTLFRILNKHKNQSGIIFANTRDKVEDIAQLLKNYKVAATFYHAGLDKDKRSQIQEAFIQDRVKIIAATNAFGMGVDKPNIRFVIHYQIPGNLENYYQEAGRAGRDLQPADCYLLFNKKDTSILANFINQSHPQKKDPIRVSNYHKLDKMIDYAQTKSCRAQFVLDYFGEKDSHNKCKNCDVCLTISIEQSETENNLVNRLKKARNVLAKQHGCHPKKVVTDKVIKLLALYRPTTQSEFLRITGIGQGWINKWFNSFSKLLTV